MTIDLITTRLKRWRAATVLLLCCALLPWAQSAQGEGAVFKWVDANGKVHYGDQKSGAAVDQKSLVDVSRGNTANAAATDDSQPSAQRVVMYSTSWCGYCKKARAYFSSNGIYVSEYDIEKSPSARREYDRLGGRGVPFITIGDTHIRGFDRAKIDATLGL